MEKYTLYKKTSPLGLKYIGKTTKDAFNYIGSGKIWIRHIEKHNIQKEDIETEILYETYDFDEFKIYAKELSEKLDIVESDEYANLRPEDGDGGDTSKYIDYNNEIFHRKERADHLNWTHLPETERKILMLERSKKIDYKNPERLRKIKENTDWVNIFKNRNIDYSNFLDDVHENNKKTIIQIDLDGNVVREWKSVVDASKELNVKSNTLRSWIYRKSIGLNSKWEYKNKK